MPIEFVGAAALVILVAAIYGGVLLWRRWRVDNPEPRETYRYGDLKVPQFCSGVRLAELVRSGYRCWDHLCVKTCCLDDTSISCSTCVLHRKNSVSRSEFLSRVGRANSYKGLMIPRADPSLELIDALRNCYEGSSSKPEQRCQGLQCIPGAVCDQCLACATHAGVLKDYLSYTEGGEKMTDELDKDPQSHHPCKRRRTILDSFNAIESAANKLEERIASKKEDGKVGEYFRGLRVPDLAKGIAKYTTLADVLLDGHVEGACWYVKCTGLSCSNCALSGLDRRQELVEFFKHEKEKSEMKKDKQSVAEDLVSKYAIPLGTDSTFSNAAYSVMLAPKYGDARELITHLRIRDIYPHDEPVRWGDYNMVLVPVGLNKTAVELADYRAKLVAAVEEFIQGGQEVRRFLKDIEACTAGSKFALKYKSMRQVWQAMIDDEQWDYMDYVVLKLTTCTAEEAYDKFEYVLSYDARLDTLKELRQVLGEHLGSKLAKSVIEELNPFARRGDD